MSKERVPPHQTRSPSNSGNLQNVKHKALLSPYLNPLVKHNSGERVRTRESSVVEGAPKNRLFVGSGGDGEKDSVGVK